MQIPHPALRPNLLPMGALHRESCSGETQRPPESGGQRGPIGSREGRFLSKPCNHAALEPPPARSRLRLDRAALLTQEGVALLPNRTLCSSPVCLKLLLRNSKSFPAATPVIREKRNALLCQEGSAANRVARGEVPKRT